MIDFSNSNLVHLVIHQVGNKLQEEGLVLSREETQLSGEEVQELFLKYLLTPFRDNEYYNLSHPSDLSFNEMYGFCSALFEDPESFLLRSVDMAKHLYEASGHPKIKSGELYVTYFEDCLLEDEFVDAIGIFKSESRETYLKVNSADETFEIDWDKGINISKLDKGCIIFNTDKEKGFKVCAVDNTNKANEAQYWKEDFLRIKPAVDDFHCTGNIMALTKDFVVNEAAHELALPKTEQAELLNRSVSYFKEREVFDKEEFKNEVLEDPELIQSFDDFEHTYTTEKEVRIPEEFDISPKAVKKKAATFKSVLKLDKNFHIYIHGKRDLIEKGYDEERGKSFYKVYFDTEA